MLFNRGSYDGSGINPNGMYTPKSTTGDQAIPPTKPMLLGQPGVSGQYGGINPGGMYSNNNPGMGQMSMPPKKPMQMNPYGNSAPRVSFMSPMREQMMKYGMNRGNMQMQPQRSMFSAGGRMPSPYGGINPNGMYSNNGGVPRTDLKASY